MPITSVAPMAVTPVNRTAHSDQATLPLINTLLTNPDARRYYLLEVEPYDPEAEATVTRTYGAGLSRLLDRDVLWHPYLVDAFNASSELFDGPLGIAGAARIAFGAIKVAVGEESERNYTLRDEFSWLEWNQRAVRVWLGGDPDDGWTFADYVPVFTGLAEELMWDENAFTIVVRDPNVRMEQPIQANLYAGTGGDEGGEDLEGKPKPIALGRPKNVSPVLVDRTNLVYQVHDGPIVAVDAVYDKGDAYTNAGDLPGGIPDVRSWSQVTGSYITDLSKGLIRLGTSPQGGAGGLVTADVQGDSDGGSLNELQGSMIRRILTERAGFSESELDLASFAALDATGRPVSIYVSSGFTVAQVVDSILLPRGYRTFDSNGRVVVGRVEFKTPALTLQPPRIASIVRDRTRLPSWRISMGYGRNWTTMAESDLAAVGLDLDADFATNEFRRVTASDASIQTRVPGAHDDAIDTVWNDADDAQAEVDDLHDLLGPRRDLYRVVATRVQFSIRPAQTIRLKHERFGLRDGKSFIVLGVTENTSTGRTTLALWG